MSPLSQSVTQRIRLEHIHSLSQLATPPTLRAPIKTDLPWPVATILRNIVLDWISSNPEAIKAAKDSQCMSPSPDMPNWGAVLFTLVESTAMYLRKDQDVFLAMQAARKGDTEAATHHLDNAQEDIDAIAQALDCKFVQLCDFAQQTPDGLWFHSGAYAGVFISNDTQKPFAGIAFKGSSSIRDFFTDFNWQPIAPKKGLIWDAHTHRGFYQGMFGQFSGKGEKRTPFDIILEQLDSVYKHPTKLHVTGHSLGGAFATLAYGEFIRRDEVEAAFRKKYDLGDLYTFGSPRTSLSPFYDKVNGRTLKVQGGGRYVFRIVNNGDMVAEVPQRMPWRYTHVGGGWKLTKQGAQKMDDEVGAQWTLPPMVMNPSQLLDPSTFMDANEWLIDHDPRKYYARWKSIPIPTAR